MINNTWTVSSWEEWRALLGIMGSWECKLRVKRWGRDLCWHGGWGVNEEPGCSIGSNLPETFLVWAPEVPHARTPSVLVGCPLGHISSIQPQFADHCLSSTPQNCAPHQVMVIRFKLSWDTQNVLLTPKIRPHLLVPEITVTGHMGSQATVRREAQKNTYITILFMRSGQAKLYF